MKLQKALKLRKKLIGEITKLKELIAQKNSYMEGSINDMISDVKNMYDTLTKKIDELLALKYVINEANREIQSLIYTISEYKALVVFLSNMNVNEGIKQVGYGDSIHKYLVHINEKERDNLIAVYQKRIDAIQDNIDEYNYTTEIPWGDEHNTESVE
jgi:hypothetical protein